MQPKIIIYIAAPDFASQYDVTKLSTIDQNRRQHQNWRVSRALKAHAPSEYGVLSHCRQHAAWAIPVSGSLKIGVDLEYIQPRHFATWQTILSPDEQSWLAQQQSLNAYFALWTLKEALIKANHGQWADLAQTGIVRVADNWQLHWQGQIGWSGRVWLLQSFALAVVWQGQTAEIELHNVGSWANHTWQIYQPFD